MRRDFPDHPVIQNMERTGYPDGKAPKMPICPVCGEPCHTVYTNIYGEIFACNGCVSVSDATDLLEDEDDG